MADFFVSYTQADRSWAIWIAWVLEEAGYSVLVQAWDFRPGGNFALDMQQAAAESERTIAVLSPDYLESRFTSPEWAAAFSRDPTGRQGLLLPIRVREVALKGLLPQIAFIDLVGLSGADAENALLAGVKRGRAKPLERPRFPGEARAAPAGAARPAFPGDRPVAGRPAAETVADRALEEIPPRGPLPPGSRMPFAPNPLYVGREEDLRAVARQLRATDTETVREVEIVAVSGLGGMGKTQLASELVYRYGRFFEGGVAWTSFADGAAVPAELAACGRGLDLHPAWDDLPLSEQVRLVQEAWNQPVARLLVFDNCEEESLLTRWRPRFGGVRVLVTSRRSLWSRALGVRGFRITTLPRDLSVELLRRFRPDVAESDPALAGIAAELGDLPLALHLAGSFLERYAEAPFGQPAAYLASLRKGSLLDHPSLQGRFAEHSPTEHELHVGRTFALSLDRLNPGDEVDALARALLTRAACLAPGEPIPRGLLLQTLDLGNEEEALLQAEDGLGRLLALGLVEAGQDGLLVLHRLVAERARSLEEAGAARRAVERALLAEAARRNEAGLPAPLLVWQPHLRSVADQARDRQETIAADLCYELGSHLQMIGDYAGARPYFERSLEILDKIEGPEHPETAKHLNNLGLLLKIEGDLEGAHRLYDRALAIWERTQGPEHPETAQGLNNLGALLRAKGDLPGARRCYERALAIRRKVLGPEHPGTAHSLSNLGVVLRAEGDLVGARTCNERALAIREQALGREHPDTAWSLNNLGLLCQAEGRPAEARRSFEQALAVREKVLGPEHPDTARSLESLGALLNQEGDAPTARAYLERALAIFVARLGPDHPDTQAVRAKLEVLEERPA